MSRIKKLLMFLVLAISLAIIPEAEACTIFAAIGDAVEGGGTLIGKTDDVKFLYHNRIIKSDDEGIPYYAIIPEDEQGRTHGIYGVNKYGLAVALAGTSKLMPAEERQAIPFNGGMREILRTCKSVDEALTRTECFMRPDFIILADSKEIALIETGVDRKFDITRTSNGILTHTNHFLNTSLLCGVEDKFANNSVTRYNRINELLTTSSHPLTASDFKAFLHDSEVCRNGMAPDSVETAGRMVVDIKRGGDFTVYFQYRTDADDTGDDIVIEKTRSEIFGY